MVNRVFELFRQTLFPPWTVEVFKIEGDKLGPRKIRFGLGWMYVRLQVGEVILRQIPLSCSSSRSSVDCFCCHDRGVVSVA